MKKKLYIVIILMIFLFLLTSCGKKRSGFFPNEVLIEKGFPNLINPCDNGYYTYKKNGYSNFYGNVDDNFDLEEFSKNIFNSLYDSEVNTYVGYSINMKGIAWWYDFVYLAGTTPEKCNSLIYPTYSFLYQINEKSFEIIIQKITNEKDFNFKISITNNPRFSIEKTNDITGPRFVHVGKKIQLYLVEEDNVIWSVEDESIAIIDQNGIVHGVREGKTKIIATSTIKKYDNVFTIDFEVYSI